MITWFNPDCERRVMKTYKHFIKVCGQTFIKKEKESKEVLVKE